MWESSQRMLKPPSPDGVTGCLLRSGVMGFLLAEKAGRSAPGGRGKVRACVDLRSAHTVRVTGGRTTSGSELRGEQRRTAAAACRRRVSIGTVKSGFGWET